MYRKSFLVVLMLVVMFLGLVVDVLAESPAHNGAEHGNGKPPAHAKAGGRVGKVNNDPDDDSRGPDRGDGTIDDYDHNNGCGNDPDRDDDNEGLCGGKPHRTPVIPPPERIPVKRGRTCKAVFYGWTPEVFDAKYDVRDPASEEFVIAEAHGYLEVSLPFGFEGKVLWYRELSGHGTSPWEYFACNADQIELWEPMGLWGGTFE